MLNFWFSVLIKAFNDSRDFMGQTNTGLGFGLLVLVLTLIWLWKKHGLKNAFQNLWRTAGEGLVITAVAFVVVGLVHLIYEPFHLLEDEKARKAFALQERDTANRELTELKDKMQGLYGEVENVAIGTHIEHPDVAIPRKGVSLFVEVGVYNKPTSYPTIAQGYAMRMRYPGFEGKWTAPTAAPPRGVKAIDNRGKVQMHLLPGDELFRKTIEIPISPGGRKDGWLWFYVPDADAPTVLQKPITVEVTFFDIYHHQYFASRVTHNTGLQEPYLSYPDPAPFERTHPQPAKPR